MEEGINRPKWLQTSSFYVKWYKINSRKTEKLKLYIVISMVTIEKCRGIAKMQIDKLK